MITLTYGRTVDLLREAVAERGADYVYSRPDSRPLSENVCLYVHDYPDGTESPGCLVGEVLHRAGVPLEALREVEHMTVRAAMRDLDGVEAPGRARDLLVAVQCLQDGGCTWGDAVEEALRDVGPDQ